jgi:hypothetical protein
MAFLLGLKDHTKEVRMEAYKHWVVALSTDYPFQRIMLSIPYLSISHRKYVLTLCRCQVPPLIGSPFLSQVGAKMRDRIILPPANIRAEVEETVSFEEYLFSLYEYAIRPISCALLSLIIRIAPYEDDSWFLEFITESYQKELASSVLVYRPVILDFRCIVSEHPKDRYLPFSPRINHEPEVATSIYVDLCRARELLRDQVLWPDIGTKLVGLDCEQHFWDVYHGHNCSYLDEEDKKGISTADAARLYVETGEWAGGVVEMRSAWLYHDLKPRVYFARGGSTFEASKYVQAIFNTILDCIPECHRINRFEEPEYSTLGPSDCSVIYDYASFTSTLEEIKNFIEALSFFFEGTKVTIIDPKEGPMQADVGEILAHYNEICNNYPEFDVSGLPEFIGRFKHTCGMLGLPGNIFSCTLLHAIHIRFIAGPKRSRTVGDDGKIYKRIVDKSIEIPALHNQLESIGELQQEKMFVFEYIDLDTEDIRRYTYQFIKRPYYRIESNMHTGRLLILPNPNDLLGIVDNMHTKSSSANIVDKLLVYNRQLYRFLARIPMECLDLDEEERRLLQRFVRSVAIQVSKRYCSRDKSPLLQRLLKSINPHIPGEFMDMSTEVFRMYQYEIDEEIVVPVPWDHDDFDGWDIGCIWHARGSVGLGYLQKMGYVESEKVMMRVTREAYTDEVVAEFLRFDYPPLQKYTVIRTIPSWCPPLLLNTR